MPSESQLLKQNAFGVGVASVNSDNQIIEARFLKAELSKIDEKQIASFLPESLNKKKVNEIISLFAPKQNIEESKLYDIINEQVVKVKYSLLKKENSAAGAGLVQGAIGIEKKMEQE